MIFSDLSQRLNAKCTDLAYCCHIPGCCFFKCDMAISGGADSLNDPFTFICFSKTPALSPTGDCRPFSQEADGTLLGEGITFFALKRLEDAERDGQHIYAVIRGIGSSSDGRSGSGSSATTGLPSVFILC